MNELKKVIEDNKNMYNREKNDLEKKLREALDKIKINENNNIIKNNNNTNNLIDNNEIKKLKDELKIKNMKLNELEQVNIENKKIKNNLEEYENYNKTLKNTNKELNEKLQNIIKENEELKKEQNAIDNNDNNDNNENSYRLNKITELEEEIESLTLKNKNYLSEIKSKEKNIEELSLRVKEMEKEIENYKNKSQNTNIHNDSSNLFQNINKTEELDEMKKKLDNALKDCENYKLINNRLMADNSEKQKNIEELNNYYEENQNLLKKIEDLKEIITEKENKYKEIFEKKEELENKLKSKEEKNPFKKNVNPLNEAFGLEKFNDGRYSMGAKETTRAEKYKKMVMDYENQIGNDLSQMNMLKSDIKSLKFKLNEKNRIINEIKHLIETGYKGCNPSSKIQKEAIKQLQEYLKND